MIRDWHSVGPRSTCRKNRRNPILRTSTKCLHQKHSIHILQEYPEKLPLLNDRSYPKRDSENSDERLDLYHKSLLLNEDDKIDLSLDLCNIA